MNNEVYQEQIDITRSKLHTQNNISIVKGEFQHEVAAS